MTIAELVGPGKARIKAFLSLCSARFKAIPKDILVVGVLLGASSLSFWLGLEAGREERQGSQYSITTPPLVGTVEPTQGGVYVASKNGSKFYLPSCTGAKKISDANKIWFKSSDEARARGFEPGSNCKGL